MRPFFSVHEKSCGFDEDVSIAMDTDYLLRAISSSYRFTTFDTLVFMGDDGIIINFGQKHHCSIFEIYIVLIL